MQKYKKNQKAKFYILFVLALVAISLLLLVFEKKGITNLFKSTNQTAQPQSNSNSDYSPPTTEEQESGDKKKDEIVQRDKAKNAGQAHGQNEKTISVIITDAGQYDDVIEVRAFIPDHYQDGTCTITITKDNQKVSKSTPAYRDVSTTICTNPLFARSEFAVSGGWQVVVSYSAEGAQGSSESKNITIN